MHHATQDTIRTNIVLTYMSEILRGVVEDVIPIKGLFAWCLTDNWEWNAGYTGRCPFFEVAYGSLLTRKPDSETSMSIGITRL